MRPLRPPAPLLNPVPPSFQSTELGLVEAEIHTALSNLDRWMKPQYTGTSALNWPAGSSVQPDPLGVVLIMGAWNYPMQLTFAPLVGAIAGGNCVMIKPGAYAPVCSHTISRLVQKYLDPDCFRVAEGDRLVTSALLEQRFDKICFTGSGFVGKLVLAAAAKHLTPCMLELGGKSPAIVDRSADLDHAAGRLVWGTFVNSGQTCVRPDFCLVHDAVADKFLQLLKTKLLAFYGRDAQLTEWFGRCINPAAAKRLAGLIDSCKAHVYHGGRVDLADRYIEPTILDYGRDLRAFSASEAMQDEIFGPILPCARYTDLEDVLRLIKELPTGKPLALYAFTRDDRVTHAIRTRTTSGALGINDCLMHLANHDLPFGGVGASGMGAYHGRRSFLAFSHEKAVLQKYAAVDQLPGLKQLLDARFPPYTPTKKAIIQLFSLPAVEAAVNIHRHPAFNPLLLCVVAWYVAAAVGIRVSVSWD